MREWDQKQRRRGCNSSHDREGVDRVRGAEQKG